MLEESTVALLESGSAQIVGLTLPDGAPFATRGWGATVGRDGASLRFMVEADAVGAAADRGTPPLGATVALTACSVRTLRSVQLKGPIVALEPATDDDLAVADRYIAAFFADVEETDGTPRALLEQMLPGGLTACVMEIRDVFDQTPGPSAGAPMASAG